jgi:hypothetical protein
MHAVELAGAGQRVQVAPDRGRVHAQVLGEHPGLHVPLLGHPPQDLATALAGQHRHLPSRSLSETVHKA